MSSSVPPRRPFIIALVDRLPFYYGWVVVAVAFVTLAVGVNARTSFSLLFPPILDEFGWSRGTIAATFSIGFIVSTLITPLIGMLMDRYGPRLTVSLGAAFTSLGLVLATYAYQPWHFYLTLGVLVVGGSISMSYIGHTLFLPNWFDRRRGLAIGLSFSGVGVGAIIMFPWMQSVIQTEGWRYSCLAIAAVLMIVLVPLNVVFQRRRPQDLGLEPDGGPPPDQAAAANAQNARPNGVVDQAWVDTDWTLKLAMKTARFWWLLIAFTSGLYVWYAVQVHQTRYLIDVGISAELAALALGLVGLGGIVGQIGVGHFSDRVGREWGWTISQIGFLATYGCLQLLQIWPEHWLMYLMVASQGLLGYGLATVFGAVPADIFAGRRYGVIFGVLAAAASAGAALGPWATGFLFDLSGNYDGAFNIAMAVCFISITAMWLAAPRKVRLVAGRIPPG
jgi:MFS family permease